jgi:hypothetical protein
MAGGLDFDGIDEVNRVAVDVGALGLGMMRQVATVAEATGERTVAGAQAIVPVLTGNLRSTIGMDMDPNGLGFEAGPTAEYGAHVELGTVYMAPQAYMGPAFDRAVADGVVALEQLLGRDLL